MNEFSSYQDSLNQYQDTSTRTETDEQLEKQIQESSPDLSSPTMEVEMDKDGNPEEVYRSRAEGLEANQERIDAQASEPSVSEQIETARDEDREFQKGIFTEAIDYLGEKLLGRSPEESQAACVKKVGKLLSRLADIQEGMLRKLTTYTEPPT